MSGHSKWKTIQHKKGAADAKRGKVFSRLSKELMLLARHGGSNPDTNASLRTAIDKARSVNMPLENIERAVKKGAGEIEGVSYDEVVYEGFSAGGVAMVVEVLTDNKNRAASEIRHIFTKHGSSFAAPGSVKRGFQRHGQIFVDAKAANEEKLMEHALEAGAEDIRPDGDAFEIVTSPAAFPAVVEALKKAGIETTAAEVSLIPDNYLTVTEKATASAVLRFVADLEDNDDVQNVYTNMDVDDSILAQLDS